MKVKLGPSSVLHMIQEKVVWSFFQDAITYRGPQGTVHTNDKVVYSICPGVRKDPFCEVLDDIVAGGIQVEVDTDGFTLFNSWQPWRGPHEKTHLHGIRFTRQKAA